MGTTTDSYTVNTPALVINPECTLTPSLGFIAGWMYLLAKSASAATAALGFAGYFLHTFGLPAGPFRDHPGLAEVQKTRGGDATSPGAQDPGLRSKGSILLGEGC